MGDLAVRHVHEKMKGPLQETSLTAIANVIQEVDQTRAFVVSRDEPDFSAWTFFHEFEQKPGFHLFALMYRSQVAGFISILPNEDRDTLDIGPMYVRPQFRGLGLGHTQVKAVVEWAESRQIKHLTIRTWGENIRVKRIVKKLGFRLDKEIPNARIDGDSTVYYVLDIDDLR